MNRRQFLSMLPVPFLPAAVLAKDDEVTIPVEPCPCDCLDPDTGERYRCWDDGTPVEDTETDDPEPVDGDDDQASSSPGITPAPPPVTVVQLPSTGSGSSVSVSERRGTD